MTDTEALAAALFPGHLFGHEGGSETCAERDGAAAAEHATTLLSALTAAGFAIVRSEELTRLRVALEVAADDVTTYMHRKGCWHDFESHAWQRIERWLVKRWTLRAAPEKGAPR